MESEKRKENQQDSDSSSIEESTSTENLDSKDDKNEDLSSENLDSKDNKNEILSTEDQLKIVEEKLLRSLAEIENQRRRFEKEIKDAYTYGSFNFAKDSLSALDNLQRAKISIENNDILKENKDLNKFIENIDIIEKDLVSIFENNKIKKIDCLNKKFDPNLHQTMLEIEDESVESGTIVQEIQTGYMYAERLLRPSFVGIAKKKRPVQEEKNEKN